MNNHQAPHFDTFLHVFDRLCAYVQLKDDFTCLCSAPSLSASTSNFAKLTLHDFTDLHVKMGFYGGVKAHCWKGGRNGAPQSFSRLLYFHNRWMPKSKSKLNFD